MASVAEIAGASLGAVSIVEVFYLTSLQNWTNRAEAALSEARSTVRSTVRQNAMTRNETRRDLEAVEASFPTIVAASCSLMVIVVAAVVSIEVARIGTGNDWVLLVPMASIVVIHFGAWIWTQRGTRTELTQAASLLAANTGGVEGSR